MSQLIEISEDLYIGEGNQKKVYHHPHDEHLCIKIAKPGKPRRLVGLKREIRYTAKYQDNLPFLAKYIQEQDTNMGTGYVFELIKNDNGKVSTPLGLYIKNKTVSELDKKVAHIYRLLIQHRAPISDTNPNNFLIQDSQNNSQSLHLVDGFGNSDFIKICDFSKHFLKKKLDRKFSSLCKRLKISSDFIK